MAQYTRAEKRRSGLIQTFIALLLLPGIAFGSDFFINEFSTSNSSNFPDSEGRFYDWVELFNAGTSAASLKGYRIEFGTRSPFALPPVTIPPGGFLALYASGQNRPLEAEFRTNAVLPGDSCRYIVPVEEPVEGWYWPDIDDSEWLAGRVGVGYGDGDDSTEVNPCRSIYIRIPFEVVDLGQIRYALLFVDYDDGFVAYVNGWEVARANIDGWPPEFNDTALTDTEAMLYRGETPGLTLIENFSEFVRNGTNSLSIQVHNSTTDTSDISAIPFLTLGIDSSWGDSRSAPDFVDEFRLPAHLPFVLKSGGDTLRLIDPEGLVADSFPIFSTPQNGSYGRYPDGGELSYYFANPTPGRANPAGGFRVISPAPRISPPAGVNLGPISVRISSNSDSARFFYTLDGSTPTTLSRPFTGTFQLDTSTVVKAIAVVPGGMSGGVTTNSYILGTPPSLPVVSISTDPFNLWDADSGIYVTGNNYDTLPPYFGANFWEDWERPAHIEFFETDGANGFAISAGIKIDGGYARYFPQKSLKVILRDRYGSGTFDYRLFPSLPVEEWREFLLRNGGADWEGAFIRDALVTGLFQGSGIAAPAYRPVLVYLNGAYWGISELREVPGVSYVEAHREIDTGMVDMFDIAGNLLAGEWNAYNDLQALFETGDFSRFETYRQAENLIDIDNFMTYAAVNVIIGNGDWPSNSNRFYRIRRPGEKWHWFLFDLDYGMGQYDPGAYLNNSLRDALNPNGPEWPNPPYATLPLRKLNENTSFRNRFQARIADLLNTKFSVENLRHTVDSLKAEIEPEIERHYTRWGRETADWRSAIADLEFYIDNRTSEFFRITQRVYGIDGTVSARLETEPSHGGVIMVNGKTLPILPFNGQFFNGIPVAIEFQPEENKDFLHWSGSINSSERRLLLAPTTNLDLRASTAPLVGTERELVINEIFFADGDAGDWIEILAYRGQFDLSGWLVSDADPLRAISLPRGTVIEENEFLILCRDTSAFRQKYPSDIRLMGNFDFDLNRNRDQIRLYYPTGRLVDSVAFASDTPWPGISEGGAETYELISPDLPAGDPANWRRSLLPEGSPGIANTYSLPEPFRQVSPAEGSIFVNSAPHLRWTSSSVATSEDTLFYQIEVAPDSLYSSVTDYTTTDTFITLSFASNNSLDAGFDQRYFWRVTARTEAGLIRASDQSPRGLSFIYREERPEFRFVAEPPFPNPSEGKFFALINFPYTAALKVTLFDLTGRRVAENETVAVRGRYRVDLLGNTASHLPSGVYAIEIRWEGERYVAKLVIIH